MKSAMIMMTESFGPRMAMRPKAEREIEVNRRYAALASGTFLARQTCRQVTENPPRNVAKVDRKCRRTT